MAIMCLLGMHKWDGCKCSACGKTRHEGSNDRNTCTRCGGVIEIATLAGLQAIAADLAGHYRLVSDIDASDTKNWNGGKGFVPIGNREHPFKGVLEGNGHTIRNLCINRGEESGVGLLSYLKSGKVRNLKLVDVEVSGKFCVGGLVGTNDKGNITECQSSGEVSGDSSVGGLVGVNGEGSINEGTITECQASGEVSGNDSVGGLVGTNNGSISKCQALGEVAGGQYKVGGMVGGNRGSISKCQAFGKVSGKIYVGGLVGDNEEGSITECQASGEVSGESYVGGLVGHNKEGRITECQASGRVSGKDAVGGLVGCNVKGLITEGQATITECQASGEVSGEQNVGGLVGWNDSNGAITECQASGEVSGQQDVGGLVGTNDGRITECQTFGKVTGVGVGFVGGLVGRSKEDSVRTSYWDIQTTGQRLSEGCGKGKTSAEMRCRNTFVGWDFEKTWQIEEGKSYPTLRCFSRSNAEVAGEGG